MALDHELIGAGTDLEETVDERIERTVSAADDGVGDWNEEDWFGHYGYLN